MMHAETIELEEGTRVELWARGPGAIRALIDGVVVWQVPALSEHPGYYKYHHREACAVTFEWDEPESILWVYSWEPGRVEDCGITVWEFGATGITRRTGTEIDAWMRADTKRPGLHFSPIRQWMNDPNGLCRIGETWHLFYQFHPSGTDWGPMHWGHAVSTDLFHWTHMPVFLHPEQNCWQLGATGGAFSGNAFRDRDGAQMFFYTERLPAYDLFSGYREIQKLARPGRGLVTAESITTVLETRPDGVEHDFRDPKVWWDAVRGEYRMILGASLDGDPAVLLYGSENLLDWRYLGPLYRAPARFRGEGARAVECPDFFEIDGKWVLVMGFVGHTDPVSGRHNLLYALVGDFRDDRFVPDNDALQLLDFGTDFYAMQSCAADGRQIAFAWLFNWEDRKPPGSPYSGEMSLPRELSLDASGRLCMAPAREFEALARERGEVRDGAAALPDAPFDLVLTGGLEGARITATQAGGTSFEVGVTDGVLWVRLPQDDGRIRYDARIAPEADLRVVHDRGIIEIFADGGAVCGTRRNYKHTSPDALTVTTNGRATISHPEA
ncbi:glycoside hydrolase family 32 protein [Maritimibacter harenae]|nr:glycoside hydrolase family 32 protein [Maritimibacter harenae]